MLKFSFIKFLFAYHILFQIVPIISYIKYTINNANSKNGFHLKKQSSFIQQPKSIYFRQHNIMRLYDSIALNKKSSFEYEFDEKFEAGIQLCGTEVKSCRKGGAVQLSDGYATIINGECWLCNVYIAECYQSGPVYQHELKRNRKLLLHKREVITMLLCKILYYCS